MLRLLQGCVGVDGTRLAAVNTTCCPSRSGSGVEKVHRGWWVWRVVQRGRGVQTQGGCPRGRGRGVQSLDFKGGHPAVGLQLCAAGMVAAVTSLSRSGLTALFVHTVRIAQDLVIAGTDDPLRVSTCMKRGENSVRSGIRFIKEFHFVETQLITLRKYLM